MSTSPEKVRRRSTDNRYRFVREVKGGAWQSRVWINGPGRGFSLNLGQSSLVHHEQDSVLAQRDAWLRSMAFVKAWAGERTIAEAVQELKDRGIVRADLVVPERAAALRPLTTCPPCELGRRLKWDYATGLSLEPVAKPVPTTPAAAFMAHVTAARAEALRVGPTTVRKWLCEVGEADRGVLERIGVRLLEGMSGAVKRGGRRKVCTGDFDIDYDPTIQFLADISSARTEAQTVSPFVLRSWLTDDEGQPTSEDEKFALLFLDAVEEVDREMAAVFGKNRPGRSR